MFSLYAEGLQRRVHYRRTCAWLDAISPAKSRWSQPCAFGPTRPSHAPLSSHIPPHPGQAAIVPPREGVSSKGSPHFGQRI